jgi:anthranilate synthase component 1
MRIITTVALPEGLDTVTLAERVAGGDCLLFEHHAVEDKRLLTSFIGLRWRDVGAPSLAEAMRHVTDADSDAVHLVLQGVKTAGAVPLADRWRADGFYVARMQEVIEIDHVLRTVTHRCDGVPQLDATGLQAALHSALAVPPRTAPIASRDAQASWSRDTDEAGYCERVRSTQRALQSLDVHGAVLSLLQTRRTDASPLAIYREMRRQNPSTYGFSWTQGSLGLAGSSPLAFVEYADGVLQLETDAGTRPVTGDAERDAQSRADLLVNPKDAAEHRVVVDAELEALGTLAAGGHIDKVVDQQVRAFSHVMHLYTVLQARLREGSGLADAIVGLMPPAAVSGMPKGTALQLGFDVDASPRGPYGGVIGLVRGAGHAQFAVIIRSLWLEGGVASTRTGGKVVPASVPEEEWREAVVKARFIVEAVERAEQLVPTGA